MPGFPIQGPLLLEVIPPSGSLLANFETADIGSFGLDALLLVEQLLVDQGSDGVILSAPTTHVQVEPGS